MVEIIKMAAIGAVNDSKPMAIMFGKVVNSAPLAVNIDPKLTLTTAQLILTNHVRDYDVEMMEVTAIEGSDGSGAISERKKFRIYNGLAAGDSVILIQMQGGQKFLVLDKVVET